MQEGEVREEAIWLLGCVCFHPDYDRGPAKARPVSPSQELWIVLGGVLRDSIRLLRKIREISKLRFRSTVIMLFLQPHVIALGEICGSVLAMP